MDSNLESEIFADIDQILFDEIENCYNSGAYRSAYIMIWISIAESIRYKLKEMSFKDSEIQNMLKELERNEKKGYSIDHLLLQYSKDLDYIDNDEFERLNTIRKMRNSYAHPTGKAPTENEVNCALATAITLVLSKPPLLRYNYANKTIEKIFNDPHYFDDDPLILKKYAKNFINRIHPDVLNFALKNILKNINDSLEDYEMKKFRQRGLIFGYEIIKEIILNNLQNENDFNLYLDEYPIPTSLLFLHKDIWTNLKYQEKNRAFGYIKEQIINRDLIWCRKYALNKLYGLYESPLFTDRQNNEFKYLLESLRYKTLIYSGIPLNNYVERIINDLESHNWGYQQYAANALFEIPEDEVSSVNDSIQEQLGRNILQSGQGNSWRTIDFIDSILNENKIYPLKFIYGIVAETLVNDDGEFRLKPRCFRTAIKISVNHPENKLIFDELNKSVKNSTLKYENNDESIEKSLKILTLIQSKLGPNKNIDNLIDSIKYLQSIN